MIRVPQTRRVITTLRLINRVEFDGVKVTFETKLKIVGVIYDNKLNWRKMASEMASSGRQALGFLKLRGLVV